MPLDLLAAAALAGPPVEDLASAKGVEPVSATEVTATERAAKDAEAEADDIERQAVLGTAEPEQAISTREHARFARLRAQLTAKRAERFAAAERLRALDHVGRDALAHGAKLEALRDQTLADLAAINDIQTAIRARIAEWNADLAAIVDRGRSLRPDPVPPSGMPLPSSAHVWAGTLDSKPRLVVRLQVITCINEAPSTADLPAAIEAASRGIPRHDPAERLMLTESGLVTLVGPDPGGHIQKRISAGIIHELTPAERDAYYDGQPITWETISHD